MQLAQEQSHSSADRAVNFVWKVTAGLAVVAGLMYVGTAVVESTIPQLPDQAQAGSASRPSAVGIGGVVKRAGEPVAIEHFHAQFNLRPGADTQAQVETF